MKKVLIATGNLRMGGAQKALVNFIKFNKNIYDINLFMFRKSGEYLNEISKDIGISYIYPDKKVYEARKKKRRSFKSKVKYNIYDFIFSPFFYSSKRKYFLNWPLYYKLIFFIKEKKCEYDVLLAFNHTKEMLLVAFAKSNAKKVVVIHGDLDWHVSETPIAIERKAYGQYDEIICVSNDSKRSFENNFPEYADKVKVLPNFMDQSEIIYRSQKFDPGFKDYVKNIVVVARFAVAKGHERLLKIHNRLINEGYHYHLHLIGNGPLLEEMKQFCKENNLTETVHFLGAKTNPYPYIAKSDCLLLPSVYEALPTVLYEALILNTKILATDVGGVRSILMDGKLGDICENNEESLYSAIKLVVSSENNRPNEDKQGKYVYPNEQTLMGYYEILGDKGEVEVSLLKTHAIETLNPINHMDYYCEIDQITNINNLLHISFVYLLKNIDLSCIDTIRADICLINQDGLCKSYSLKNEVRKDATIIMGNNGECNYDYSGFVGDIDLNGLLHGKYNLYIKIGWEEHSMRLRIKEKLFITKDEIKGDIGVNSRGNLFILI